jgi:hypothetical protein
MKGTIQCTLDLDAKPKMKTLVAMVMLAMSPIPRRISGASWRRQRARA